jgi:chitin disaccharide deacetylase
MNSEAAVIDEPGDTSHRSGDAVRAGVLIVNADDWGRDWENTDRTLDCVLRGTVSAVSAMVFMEDSERASAIALEKGLDAGLHLNFTTQFSGSGIPAPLIEHQARLMKYLRGARLSQILFHPGLASSFAYVVSAQLDEYSRLYGSAPKRLDGHHHMHLCANVLYGNLLPAGTIVRRNFSFRAGEKSYANRIYRQMTDRKLAKRHTLTHYFYSLPPLEPRSRLQRIFALATESSVEVETHPVVREEYNFLLSEEFLRMTASLPTPRSLPEKRPSASV